MLTRRLPQGLIRPRSTPLLHPTLSPTSAILRVSSSPSVTPSTFTPTTTVTNQTRPSSSSSNSRWKTRQSSDFYARSARTAQLRSRAAFKLLEINKKHRIFRPNQGQIVVDLGFAPGSWSQVALDCTKPDGKVVGIDIIPAQPPKGVSAIQGNFLTEGVRGLVKGWLKEEEGRRRVERLKRERERVEMERLRREREEREAREAEEAAALEAGEGEGSSEVVSEGVEVGEQKKDGMQEVVEGMEKLEVTGKSEDQQQQQQQHRQQHKRAEETAIVEDRPSYIELERMAVREAQLQQKPEISEQQDQQDESKPTTTAKADGEKTEADSEHNNIEQLEEEQQQQPKKKKQPEQMRLVDVVLSDMSEPWPQTSGFSIKTLSNPYDRLMNTSGISFKDHAGSMDLCYAALSFANDTLKPGGHFVCKFYQGSEDKQLENMLRKLFTKVFRDKPDSSRSESKEAYFVALHRKGDVILEDIPV